MMSALPEQRKGRPWLRILSWVVVAVAAVIVTAVFFRERIFVRVEKRSLPLLTEHNPFGQDRFHSHISPRVEELPSTPASPPVARAAPAAPAAPAALAAPAAPAAPVAPVAPVAPALSVLERPQHTQMQEPQTEEAGGDPNFTHLDLS